MLPKQYRRSRKEDVVNANSQKVIKFKTPSKQVWEILEVIPECDPNLTVQISYDDEDGNRTTLDPLPAYLKQDMKKTATDVPFTITEDRNLYVTFTNPFNVNVNVAVTLVYQIRRV